MNEHRLTELEQFADILRRENIEDMAVSASNQKLLADTLQRLEKFSHLQQLQIVTMRWMIESLINHHPDREAVKSTFQKRLAFADTNISEGGFEHDFPIERTRQMKEAVNEVAETWIRGLFPPPANG